MSAPTVAAALIVRDEARVLARCLDALHGAVDELVVVDTGSSDATRDIAARYTDRLFDFAWCDDFSAARQFAFDRATADWVLWVDADDVVQNAARIRPLVAAAPADVAGFRWQYVYARDAHDRPRCVFWRERCVRHDGRFRWHGRVHEYLASSQPATLQNSRDVVVEHRPEARRLAGKQHRNLALLEAELAAAGDRPQPRTLFYLAGEYAAAGQPAAAIAAYRRYLRIADWDDEAYLAQTRLAGLYRAAAAYDQAIDADLAALKRCPHWPNAYFGLAESYYYLADWPKVIHWSEMGRAMPLPETTHFVDPLAYHFDWIIHFANALYHVGELAEAQAWTRHALTICPDDPWHRENDRFFARQLAAAAAQPLKEDLAYEHPTA